jgi:hypothetical protein
LGGGEFDFERLAFGLDVRQFRLQPADHSVAILENQKFFNGFEHLSAVYAQRSGKSRAKKFRRRRRRTKRKLLARMMNPVDKKPRNDVILAISTRALSSEPQRRFGHR